MIKRILLGLGGTPYTSVAIQRAVVPAKRFEAKITGFFIGNPAEKVLQQVNCSVLTVEPGWIIIKDIMTPPVFLLRLQNSLIRELNNLSSYPSLIIFTLFYFVPLIRSAHVSRGHAHFFQKFAGCVT